MYKAVKQFAYIDPAGKFQRFGTPIISDKHLQTCKGMIPHKAEYISVYGWTGWKGGQINAEISKTAVIDGIFLDFDDKDDPQKAVMDAAEVAAYVGHCTGNFSGWKGAHIWMSCNPVDLIPDLKGHVIRQFVNNLVDVLPELDTLDFAVVGDTSRVHRIVDSVHPGTKLHAIGLTAEELATLSIEEIMCKARNSRRLIQIPGPSQWVTDELMRIEGDLIIDRFKRLHEQKLVSEQSVMIVIDNIHMKYQRMRGEMYDTLTAIEDEWGRIRTKQQLNLRGSVIRGSRIGATKEENWLLKAVAEFKATGRAASGNRTSEHKARVHLAKLADECGWTLGEICDIYSGADDYDPGITERMVRSCLHK